MNTLKRWPFSLISVLSLYLCPNATYAQAITWDDKRAVLLGKGCKKDVDAFVTQNGDDLSVVFTKLGVNLPGGSSPLLMAQSNCLVSVPASIAPGNFIGRLTQNISYGVTKTEHTKGSVLASSNFFGMAVSPHQLILPDGKKLNTPLANIMRQDLFNTRATPMWLKAWCARSRASKGIFSANISVFGQKDNKNESLIMFVDGMDLKFEVAVSIQTCEELMKAAQRF